MSGCFATAHFLVFFNSSTSCLSGWSCCALSFSCRYSNAPVPFFSALHCSGTSTSFFRIPLMGLTKSHNRTGPIMISWFYQSFLVPFEVYPPRISISLHLSPVLVIHVLLFSVRRFLHSYNLFNNKLPREALAMAAACLRALVLYIYIYLATICCHLPHPYYFQRSSKVRFFGCGAVLGYF